MEDTGETSLLLDSAEQRIFDIRQGKALKGLERLNEVLFETFERLDRLNSPDKTCTAASLRVSASWITRSRA